MKIYAIVALLCLSLSATLVHAQGTTAVQSGALPRGGRYLLQPDPSVSTAAIELWFRAPSAGYKNDSPGIAQLAASACAAAKLEGGRSLAEFVHGVGGQLDIDVYPDMVSVTVVVPSELSRRTIATMTAAYFSPRITTDAYKVALGDAAVLITEQKYNPERILQDALFQQLFTQGPAHVATLPSAADALASISLDAVKAYANQAFQSVNAVLTLAGNIDATQLSAVTDGNPNGTSNPPLDSQMAHPSQAATIPGPIDGIGLAWAGPPISDEKAATALDFVNDYVFRDGSGMVQKDIERLNAAASAKPRVAAPAAPLQIHVAPSSPAPAASEKPGAAASPPPKRIFLQLTLHPAVPTPPPPVGVTGQFITLHDPGVMIVAISGGAAGTASARDAIVKRLTELTHPLDAKTFASALQAFKYHILSDTQTPQTQADNLGWYTIQGASSYAPGDPDGTYLRNLASLDPEYVAAIVRKYIGTPVVVHMHPARSGESAQ